MRQPAVVQNSGGGCAESGRRKVSEGRSESRRAVPLLSTRAGAGHRVGGDNAMSLCSINSGRGGVVVLEQPAEPLATLHLARREWENPRHTSVGGRGSRQ